MNRDGTGMKRAKNRSNARDTNKGNVKMELAGVIGDKIEASLMQRSQKNCKDAT
jgi:hypothetical protein